MSADTPVSVGDLRAFKRDLLFAIRALERDDSPPKGLDVQAALEAGPYNDVNHSRLYQNLDALDADGYIEKRERDGRTNEYATTDQTRTLLEAHARRRAHQTGVELQGKATDQTESAPEQTDADVSEREVES